LERQIAPSFHVDLFFMRPRFAFQLQARETCERNFLQELPRHSLLRDGERQYSDEEANTAAERPFEPGMDGESGTLK
jgi:hypothetical protein